MLDKYGNALRKNILTPEIMSKVLTKEDIIFLFENLMEFPYEIKMPIEANISEFIRLVYSGPLYVSSNCPVRTIFHEWAVQIISNPSAIQVCKSSAKIDAVFNNFNSMRTSPNQNRNKDLLIKENCHTVESVKVLINNLEDFRKKFSANPWVSRAEKESYILYLLNVLQIKTNHMDKVVDITRLLVSEMNVMNKKESMLYDIDFMYQKEFAHRISKLTNMVLDTFVKMIRSQRIEVEDPRTLGILERMCEYIGLPDSWIPRYAGIVFDEDVKNDIIDWYAVTKMDNALEEFSQI